MRCSGNHELNFGDCVT